MKYSYKPNSLLLKLSPKLKKTGLFLDLGFGNGADIFYMLKKGWKTVGVDTLYSHTIDIFDINKNILNRELNIENFFTSWAGIEKFRFNREKYDVVQAHNSIQFLELESGFKAIARMKFSVKKGGYVIISAFTVADPSYSKNSESCYFAPNELKEAFHDFKIIFYKESVKNDKGHPGLPWPHKHGLVKMIAKKIN
jgi:SAM-dependent methyltransferase